VIFGIWPGVAAADLISLQPLDCPAEDTAKTRYTAPDSIRPSTRCRPSQAGHL